MTKIMQIFMRSVTIYHYISLQNDESTLLVYRTKMKKSGAGGKARTSMKGGDNALHPIMILPFLRTSLITGR